ncbi:MAG: fasciclin domain-containing protein [Clostridia bacterium]
MKKVAVVVLVLMLTMLLSANAFADEEADIVDTAVAAGDFETLVTALTATGLDEALRGDGPFTVFAPTDEAFAALPEGTLEKLLDNPEILENVLLYHVVEGEVTAADAAALDGESVATLSGQSIDISADGGVFINDAEVTTPDVECSNGVIHVIDSVLLPEFDIVETAILDDDFNTLVTALTETGLDETLSGDGPFTVFAPTDEAFAALPEGTLDALLADPDALVDILLYHVVSGSVPAADVVGLDGQKVATFSGDELTVTVEDGDVFVDDSQVVVTDVGSSNGIIHVIDAVLVPEPAESAPEAEDETAEPEEDTTDPLPETGGPGATLAFWGLLSAIGGAYLVARKR